jgi:hypothetical protein
MVLGMGMVIFRYLGLDLGLGMYQNPSSKPKKFPTELTGNIF